MHLPLAVANDAHSDSSTNESSATVTDAHEHTDSDTDAKVVTLPSSKMATGLKVMPELVSRAGGKKKLSHGDLLKMKNQLLLNTTLEAS